MRQFLFYNGSTGSGAVGVLDDSGFRTTQSFADGSFSTGWTHVKRMLFYKASTGEAALGLLNERTFTTVQSYSPHLLGSQWTHLFDLDPLLLFYRAPTGEGALVRVEGDGVEVVSTIGRDGLGRGWTHVVYSGSTENVLLFYNADTNEAGLSEGWLAKGAPPVRSDWTTVDGLALALRDESGSTQWTHIVADTRKGMLFYDQKSGAGAAGSLTRNGFEIAETYPSGVFAPGWTHIVSARGSTLFYNELDGSAALDFDPAAQEFPPGSFSTGWSHVVSQVDPEDA